MDLELWKYCYKCAVFKCQYMFWLVLKLGLETKEPILISVQLQFSGTSSILLSITTTIKNVAPIINIPLQSLCPIHSTSPEPSIFTNFNKIGKASVNCSCSDKFCTRADPQIDFFTKFSYFLPCYPPWNQVSSFKLLSMIY